MARIYCAGVHANAAMVRDGVTWAFTKYLTDPKIIEIEEKRGLDARVCGLTLLRWHRGSVTCPWLFGPIIPGGRLGWGRGDAAA